VKRLLPTGDPPPRGQTKPQGGTMLFLGTSAGAAFREKSLFFSDGQVDRLGRSCLPFEALWREHTNVLLFQNLA